MAKPPLSVHVQVEGAAQLRLALLKARGNLNDLKDVHQDAANKVRGEAKARVPVVTGNLGGSIGAFATGQRGFVTAGHVPTVPYAGPIHFGWPKRNIEPQPFLYEALDARRTEVEKLYVRRVDEIVRQIDAETPG